MAIKVNGGKLADAGTFGDSMQSIAKGSSELAEFFKSAQKSAPMSVGRGSQVSNPMRIPTGMFEFDLATNGGFPCGRYSVIYGPESSGKTNTVYLAIANAQKMRPPCNVAALVDVEGTFDPSWAAQHGVDVENLILIKPEYGEQAVDLIASLVSIDSIAFIGVDSVAAIISSREAEASTEKADVGSQAMLVKRMCNKLVLAFNTEAKRNHFPAVVLINQTRFKIGVMFGDPEHMPCGQTLKFLSSLTIRVSAKNKLVKDISSQVPAFKEVSMVVKKAKIPINSVSASYDMTVIAHDVLGVGDTASWNLVESSLKQNGVLKKDALGKYWVCGTVRFPKLADFGNEYYTNPKFKADMQKLVISLHSKNAFLMGENPTPEAVEKDVQAPPDQQALEQDL